MPPANQGALGGPDGGSASAPGGGHDDPTTGATCAQSKANVTPHPIRIATGDKEETETDFMIGALKFVRNYHSQSTYNGRMGYGWTWTYGWKLSPPAAGRISIRRADGKAMLFADNGSGIFRRQLERGDETVTATPGGWRYTHHNGSTADFDAAGNLISLNSEDGQTISLAYDAAGNPVSIIGPHGRTLKLTTNIGGRIASITGPLGRVWSYAYDANGNLASVSYPDGTSRRYQYADANDAHNLTGIIDEAGRIYKRITYDVQDRAILSELPLSGVRDAVIYNADGSVDVTEANGTTRHHTVTIVNGIPSVTAVSGGACLCGTATSFTLDPVTGLMTGSQDKSGVANIYSYDANGRLTAETQAVGTAVERTTAYTYDAAGHVISVTDALGQTTRFTYDANGHRLSTSDALGHVSSNTWNAAGTLASVTAADGGLTRFTYNAFGQVVQIIDANGSSRSLNYDAAGRLLALTDAAGATTNYTYDTRDRVTSITYADGTSVRNVYDLAGDLVSSTDAAGLVTTYVYDVEHRPVSMTRPDGVTLTSGFDPAGNLTARSVLNSAGVSVSSENMRYDADGRLTGITHADSTSTANTYDMLGRLLTRSDESGKATGYSYDALGRLISETNANNETVTYAYDAMDRRVRATDAGNVSTQFSYDALGRVLQETSADRGVTSYSYGVTGDLLSKTDANGVVANYAYDAMHRLTSISYPGDPTRNVGFAYDAAGRMLSMTDAGGVTQYSRDVMGRLTSASWSPAGSALTLTLAYAYDAAGRLSTLTYPTGRKVSFSYGPAGRMNAVDSSVNGSPVNLVSAIRYDAFGGVVSRTLGNGIVETRSRDSRGRLMRFNANGVLSRSLIWNPASTIASITDNLNPLQSQNFIYDPAQRLTGATGAYGNLSFTYDANGNRMLRSDAAGQVFNSYAPGTNRLAGSGATIYTRDAAGNRLRDGRFSYTYAANNRLIAVADSLGNPLAAYTHNGKGERVVKTANGVSTYYVYDVSGRLIGEYDSSGAMLAEHIYGPSGRIVSIATRQVPLAMNNGKTGLLARLDDGFAALASWWRGIELIPSAYSGEAEDDDNKDEKKHADEDKDKHGDSGKSEDDDAGNDEEDNDHASIENTAAGHAGNGQNAAQGNAGQAGGAGNGQNGGAGGNNGGNGNGGQGGITPLPAPADITPPVVTAPAPVTIEATGLATPAVPGAATAIDNVSGVLVPLNNAPAGGFPLGVTTITYTATDAAGNIGTAVQTVTVVDTTPPTITAPAAQTAISGDNQPVAVNIGTATASDLVSGVVPVTNNAPATFPVGTTTVIYTATDAAGNTATATQTVTVNLVDTTPPVVTAPAAITVEATGTNTTVALGTATAIDLVSGVVPVTNNAPAAFPLGVTTVTYSATDAAGNIGTATQTVTVTDTTAPTITTQAAVMGTSGDNQPVAVTLGTATATDLVDGRVVVTNNAPATFPVGTTTVTYTATDTTGNTATVTQLVIVNLVDTTPPVVTAPAAVSVEATGATTAVVLGKATALDIVDGVIVPTSNAPAAFPLGTTTVTYSATDAAGNIGTATQTVTVVDTTPPNLLLPAAVTTTVGNNQPATVNIGTATATDVFAVTVTNDAPAVFPIGTTTVTWTATDANGNTTSGPQTVTVNLVDTTPPVISVPADVFTSTSAPQATVNIGTASAVDKVDGLVAVSTNAPATFPVGVTTVTYTATDAAGNTATATQRVVVSFVSTVGGGTGTGGGTTTPPAPGGGATVTTEAVYWHHNDHLGTPQALTDVNGTVVWTASYTPFGIATVNEDPDGDGFTVTNNFRFPGQYYDAETGLNYNYQRTYDPTTGRYTQSDPIGLDGGLNTFGYVNGNPVTHVDSNGLFYSPSLEFGPLGEPKPLTVVNASVGFGGSGQFMVTNTSADSGIAVDSSGNVCMYSTLCSGVGVHSPLGGELGFVVSAGKGEICSGKKVHTGFYWMGGSGIAGQGQVLQDGSVSRVLIGVGGSPDGSPSVGAGVIRCTTTYICPFK